MIKAQVKRTNSGTYYLQLNASGKKDQLMLGQVREQMRLNTDKLVEFGGASGTDEDTNLPLELQLNLRVEEKPEPKPRQKRFLWGSNRG